MVKKNKLWIIAVCVAGAILVLAQAVWADGDTAKKPESVPVTAAEHAAHHPESPAAAAQAENKEAPAAHQDMMKMMGGGDMDQMMKMMGSGGMDEMMKTMQMMQTPEGKQMMDKCQEMLKQQPSADVQG